MDDKRCILAKEVKIGAYGGNNDHIIFVAKLYDDGRLRLLKNTEFKEINCYKNAKQRELCEDLYNKIENLPVNHQLSQEELDLVLGLKKEMSILHPVVGDEGLIYTPSHYYVLHNMKTESGKSIDFRFCSTGSGMVATMGAVYKLNDFFKKKLGVVF